MTANASPQDQRVCLAVGMNDYLTKPVEPKHLLATVARWVGGPAGLPVPAPPKGLPAPVTKPIPDAVPGLVLASMPVSAPNAERAPDDPILDPQVLRTLTRGSASALAPIVKVFETMMDRTLVELQQALAARDAQRLGQLGHKAKSSAAALGAQGLARHCHALETAMRATEPDLAVAAELVQQIQRLSPLVVQALRAELAAAP